MDELINTMDYQSYKKQVDDAIEKSETGIKMTLEGFVQLGYLFEKARSNPEVLKGSEYKNVNEFAEKEYQKDKTQVSKYIGIYLKFRDENQEGKLQERYEGFGVAKLAIMTQLPDAINEILTPNLSKSEIQIIKEEVEAEQNVSDIERMLEHVPENIAAVDDVLGRTIIAFGEAEPELYYDIHKQACWDYRIDIERLKDELIPNDEAIYSIRVPGAGRFLLSLKDKGENTLTNIRTGEKETYTWEEIAVAWTIIIDVNKDPEEDWAEQYARPFPKQEEEQKEPEQKKPETRKQSKVVKAKTEKPVQQDKKPEIAPVQQEEQEPDIEIADVQQEDEVEDETDNPANTGKHPVSEDVVECEKEELDTEKLGEVAEPESEVVEIENSSIPDRTEEIEELNRKKIELEESIIDTAGVLKMECENRNWEAVILGIMEMQNKLDKRGDLVSEIEDLQTSPQVNIQDIIGGRTK